MKLFNIMATAFDSFDNTVRTYLQKTFNDLGYNYTHNQIFGVIFDGIKGIMQNVMFYIEDAFTEQNIYTAQRKRSVYSLAKISGYEPYYGSAATGTIIINVNINNKLSNNSNKIYIYNESVIKNKNTNVLYTIILPTDYYIIDNNKPLINHEFKIVQGVYKTSNYISKGNSLETINLNSKGLWDENYIKVIVNGIEWTQVSNLYEMTENSETYIINTGYDNIMNIMFGNGVNGKIPEAGQTILIKYINHSGENGNITNYDDYDFEFDSYGYDTEGNNINLNEYCSIKINNIVSGGNNADSIEIVRNMIGYNSRSNVLASEENYKLFLKRFSFIGQSSIWSEENSSCVIISALSNYYTNSNNIDNYFNSNINNFFLTENQKNMILDTLNKSNKAFTGITIKFKDPIIRKFAMICYVKANNVYNRESITDNIKTIVAKYFINLKSNTQFIPKSDIIKEISNNDNNIEAIDFQFISELSEQTYYNGYYLKQHLQYTNKSYIYNNKKVFYEENIQPGLDEYGNISLDSKLEIPVLRGGFNYYPNKQEYDKTKNVFKIDTIQVFFI